MDTAQQRDFIALYHQSLGRLSSQAMQQIVDFGGYPGAAPLGYRNCRRGEQPGIELDPAVAPLVKEAFQQAAHGMMSLREILSHLENQGLKSRRGKALSVSRLWGMLTNPVYCGMLRYKGELRQGRHEAIVSRELFDRVQIHLHRRRRYPDETMT